MDLPEIYRPDDAAALVRLVGVDFDPDRPARHYTAADGRPRFTRCGGADPLGRLVEVLRWLTSRPLS